jgi:hypothetical protein
MATTVAEPLVVRLEAAIAPIEGCPEERWTALIPANGWSFAATAHHIAVALRQTFTLARCIATGERLPALVPEEMEAANQEHARAFAACTRNDTLTLLRSSRDAVLNELRRLSADELARTGTLPILGGSFSAGELIDLLVIGHVREHLAQLQAQS